MNKLLQFFFISLMLIFLASKPIYSQSTLDCSLCHSTEYNTWMLSHHANTQMSVADELAGEWAGLPPDSVINGQDAEDCIACHGASAIMANSGMTEVQAMGYFFSTTAGLYTDSTYALNTDEWPNNACVTCHDVPDNHPDSLSLPTLAIFNSPTAGYNAVTNASMLCGQCHGTLRYADTDHRRLDAWQMSKHGHGGQADVAGELGEEWSGSTPEEVIGEEDCIACHASTSVLLNGGISESDALDLLFTTTGGVFDENTAPNNTGQWPEVSCTACHNQHNPNAISYFNSSTKEYEEFATAQELCGMCHGNLRFPDTDHLSYNIEQGTGGIGVVDQQTMPGVQCIDCHMHAEDIDGSNSTMYGGHLWQVFIGEDNGDISASCTSCHASMTASVALDSVTLWQARYDNLVSLANNAVAIADTALINSTDSTLINLLEEAQFNLNYAQSDESGGAHNHFYVQSLLNDAISKAEEIVSGIFNSESPEKGIISLHNFPNPFSSATTIEYKLPKASNVTIEIFNFKGQKISTLLKNNFEAPGKQSVKFNSYDLPNGVYFCSLKAGQFKVIVKMILLH